MFAQHLLGKKNHHHGSAVSYQHMQIPLTSHVDELPEKLPIRPSAQASGHIR